MGKRSIFSKIRKWCIFLLIIVAIVVAGKQKKETEGLTFWGIGKKYVWDSFLKQMLYSQSMVLGFLMEQELPQWSPKTVMKMEGFLPYENGGIIVAAKDPMEEAFLQENEQAVSGTKEEFWLESSGRFVPVKEKQRMIYKEDYRNLEALIKNFYTVDPTTAVEESFLNIEDLLSYNCSINKNTSGPQILLYHTHSQEAFVDSKAGVEEDTILGAGEVLASYLEEYGFSVYHHKGKYDVESRDYAYSNALPEVEQILKEHPEIEVVIDLHRDAVAETTRLVTELQGRETAKVMFFNGLSRTKAKGEIDYLKNPYLQENLAFSFQMKKACDEYYPGFARNIYLRAYRYNMHLCPKTLLIELGAQTNTKEEIWNALEPLAHVLDMVLSG